MDPELKRKVESQKHGLSETASWSDIWDAIAESMDNSRRIEIAQKLGLPENTSWVIITEARLEQTFREIALNYGLPENATCAEISRAQSAAR